MKNLIIGAILIPAFVASCGSDESEENGTEVPEEVYECPDVCDLTVDYAANSQGQDSTFYEHSGAFEVLSTDLIYFHDSTIVMKIENYDGRRELPEHSQLYLSLYTKNGVVLGEGEYTLDHKSSMQCNLLIYAGTGMLVLPTHLAEGNVTVGSYSKDKICGEMDFSMKDEDGFYGSVNVNGKFVVDAK